MARPIQIGDYELLRRLSEDALGDLFRAGRGGGGRLDEIVLLRIYNGRGIDAELMAKGLFDRPTISANAHLAAPVTAGRSERGPYSAYPYDSGVTLSQLLRRGTERFDPLPPELAVLVAERAAAGLLDAAKIAGHTVLHGLPLPELVFVTHAGEIRVLGTDAGQALRAATGQRLGSLPFAPFASPEARLGQTPRPEDDVYALGAILYQLVTEKVPPATMEAVGEAVEGATLAGDGEPLPAALRDLIAASLAPLGERITDLETWHGRLAEAAREAGYCGTPFDLAYSMHNLFREDIAHEDKASLAEARGEARFSDKATSTAPPAGPPPAPGRAMPPRARPTPTLEPTYEELAERESSKGPLIIASTIAAVVLAVAVFFLSRPTPTPAVAPTPEPAASAPAAPPPEVQGPTPEEIQADLEALLADQTAAMNENLQREYAERIATMRTELQAAETRAATARAQASAPAAAPAPEAAAEPSETPPAAADEPVTTPPPPASPAEAPLTVSPAPPASGAASETPESRTAAQPEPAPSEPEQATPPARAAPPAASVRRGEIVAPGPGVVAPSLVSLVAPEYTTRARRARVEGIVIVSVLVNEQGRVDDAKFLKQIPQDVGLNEAAMEAARAARYTPATKDGVPVRMWQTLTFPFQL